MKLFSKAAGVIAAALLITGGVVPVAQSQPNQVVTPEQQDSYIQQFHHEGDTPPVVDGVGGYTDAEIAEIHDAIQQAQESGAPNDKLIPGEMWSDKVELPATIDKAAADEAEIAIAQQQSQPQARALAAARVKLFGRHLIKYVVLSWSAIFSKAHSLVGCCCLVRIKHSILMGRGIVSGL